MSEIFALIMKIGERNNVFPITDRVWTYKVDEQWTFKVNGFRVETDGIPPFHAVVEFNGWPAGIIGYQGGVIAAGEAANEETFINALKAVS